MVPAWLLERLTGRGEHDPLVQGLAAQDFLFPDETAPGWLRFKHGITRDVIYDSVGLHSGARCTAHRRALRGHGSAAKPAVRGARLPLRRRRAPAGRRATPSWPATRRAAAALDRAQTQYRAALAALDLLAPTEVNRRSRAWWCSASAWRASSTRRGAVGVLRRAAEFAAGLDDPAGIAGAEYWLGYSTTGWAIRASRSSTASADSQPQSGPATRR